jgi:hypothetical protein
LVLNEGGAVEQALAADHHRRSCDADRAGQAAHRRPLRRCHPGWRGEQVSSKISTWPSSGAEYVPRAWSRTLAHHARYMDYFALYKQLYAHVKEDFASLARLREKYA